MGPISCAPHQLHGGRHEQGPDDGGVDHGGHRQAEAELFDHEEPSGPEAREHHDDQQRGRRDDAPACCRPSATAVSLSPVRSYTSLMRESRNTS